jgi:hypothetical protein
MGLKMGKTLAEGKLPTFKINPVKRVKEFVDNVKETKKEEEVLEELEDILSATKEGMLNSIKKGVS